MPIGESSQDFQKRWRQNIEALGEQALSGDMEGAYHQACRLAEADNRGEKPRLVGSEIQITPPSVKRGSLLQRWWQSAKRVVKIPT